MSVANFLQDDELTILDVRKFKPIHKRKFNYEVISDAISWYDKIFLCVVQYFLGLFSFSRSLLGDFGTSHSEIPVNSF